MPTEPSILRQLGTAKQLLTRAVLMVGVLVVMSPLQLTAQNGVVRLRGGSTWSSGTTPGLVSYLSSSSADLVYGDSLFFRGLILNSADTVVRLPPKNCEIRVTGLPTLEPISSPVQCNPGQSVLAPGDSLVAEAAFLIGGAAPPGTYLLSVAWAQIEESFSVMLRMPAPARPEHPLLNSPPKQTIPVLLLADVDTAGGLSSLEVQNVVMMAGLETRSLPYLIASRLPSLRPGLTYLWFHVSYSAEGDHRVEIGSARGPQDPAAPRLDCRHVHRGRSKLSVFREILRLDAALALQNFAEQRCLP